MTKYFPAVMYFQTSIILIDDDINFLEIAKKNFANISEIITFSSARDALNVLNRMGSFFHSNSVCKIITKVEATEIDFNGELFELSLRNSLSYAKDKEKNKLISVVIVDYSLSCEDSLDFCRIAKSIGLRVIMLTGIATDKVAVNAFNEGIIDRFVSKHEENLFLTLNRIVEEEKMSFFENLHSKIIPYFFSDTNLTVNNREYFKKFNDLLKKSEAIEYYMIDHKGSCVFIDPIGRVTILACQNDADIEKYIGIAIDNEADSTFIQTLRNKKKILFLLADSSINSPVSLWKNYLYEAEIISEGFYCSVITNTDLVEMV